MSYKTILVHADLTSGMENRIRVAAGLARQFHGRVIGAAARLPVPLVQIAANGTSIIAGGMMDTGRDDVEAELKAAEKELSLIHI